MTELLTSSAAADRLGVTVRAVNAARVRGALRAARQVGEGRRATYYYDPTDVDEYGKNRQIGWPKGKARKEPEMPISKWSLQKIKDTVLDDFNIIIDTDTAADIRDADARGTLVWTPTHLVTTDGIRIEPNDDRLPRQYEA